MPNENDLNELQEYLYMQLTEFIGDNTTNIDLEKVYISMLDALITSLKKGG